ncbi:MAG: hypothetical protein PVJ49_06305 [Acidobacteriota bacterium]|jgi:hypothetical protein
MFLSARRIEENKAAGLGVAGRRMKTTPKAVAAVVAGDAGSERPEMGVLARALRRYGQVARREAA